MTENKRFKLIDNHLIMYDGDYFDLHKPSDVRSLIKVLNYVADENEQLKETNQKVIRLIHEAIVEALDGARYNVERLLEEALQELEKGERVE